MNDPIADSPGAATAQTDNPGVAAPSGGLLSGHTLVTLIRREFWEHRVLWMAPLAVAALLLICAVPAHVNPNLSLQDEAQWLDSQHRAGVFGVAQWALTVPHFLVMVIVLNFYLLDCLNAERKDRSILFWKSLPVSDGATVASKLLVGLVVVPFGVFLVALVTTLLFTAIWNTRAALGHAEAFVLWDTVTWLKVQALMLYGLVVSILWYAPLAAYLLLVSAWARRNVFLWATLPPLLAVIVERIAFGTHFVGGLIQYRTWGIWSALDLPLAGGHATMRVGNGNLVSLSRVFDDLNIGVLFTNIDLWLGVMVAAAFAFTATRIRRYRDEN
jgi:ABC-2 type transport system permease protein